VTPLKADATATAYQRFKAAGGRVWRQQGWEFEQFCGDEAQWLDPLALFLAVKERNGGAPWWEWPQEQRRYEPGLVARMVRGELSRPMELAKFRQFLFFAQWHQLRNYAHQRGVRLIGDMPIFVSPDSADVWAHPELFQLDDERRPTFVAGVPPDYFSATGQLWGNPLYAWKKHRETGYAWWISRLTSTLKLVDVIRLDHFRGFEAYWAVPAGSTTAEPVSLVPVLGRSFFTR
jgi:4-alpha-glucanotransferase